MERHILTKLRQALARAVYCEAAVLVLDDALSAVDTETSSKIMNRLFGENGLLKGLNVTIVMTTSRCRSMSPRCAN